MANEPLTDENMYDYINNEPYKKVVLAGYDSATGVTKITDSSPALTLTTNVTLLDAVTASGASSAVNMSNYNKFSVQITKTGTATVDIEGSNDGTTWDTIASNQDGIPTFGGKYNYVRVNVSSYTDGSITAVLFAGN